MPTDPSAADQPEELTAQPAAVVEQPVEQLVAAQPVEQPIIEYDPAQYNIRPFSTATVLVRYTQHCLLNFDLKDDSIKRSNLSAAVRYNSEEQVAASTYRYNFNNKLNESDTYEEIKEEMDVSAFLHTLSYSGNEDLERIYAHLRQETERIDTMTQTSDPGTFEELKIMLETVNYLASVKQYRRGNHELCGEFQQHLPVIEPRDAKCLLAVSALEQARYRLMALKINPETQAIHYEQKHDALECITDLLTRIYKNRYYGAKIAYKQQFVLARVVAIVKKLLQESYVQNDTVLKKMLTAICTVYTNFVTQVETSKDKTAKELSREIAVIILRSYSDLLIELNAVLNQSTESSVGEVLMLTSGEEAGVGTTVTNSQAADFYMRCIVISKVISALFQGSNISQYYPHYSAYGEPRSGDTEYLNSQDAILPENLAIQANENAVIKREDLKTLVEEQLEAETLAALSGVTDDPQTAAFKMLVLLQQLRGRTIKSDHELKQKRIKLPRLDEFAEFAKQELVRIEADRQQEQAPQQSIAEAAAEQIAAAIENIRAKSGQPAIAAAPEAEPQTQAQRDHHSANALVVAEKRQPRGANNGGGSSTALAAKPGAPAEPDVRKDKKDCRVM